MGQSLFLDLSHIGAKGWEMRILFPEGKNIAPTYSMGVPLGAEKPLMEPKVRAGEDKK